MSAEKNKSWGAHGTLRDELLLSNFLETLPSLLPALRRLSANSHVSLALI